MFLRTFFQLGTGHLRSAIRNRFFPKNPILQRNERFRNVHRGQRCFILGSGPSIGRQDLQRLKGEIVMTQNNFHAHPDVSIFRPRYHCVVPKYQPAEFDPDWMRWFRSMEESLPPETIHFHGLQTRSFIERSGFFRGRCFYVDPGLSPLFLRRAPIDIARRIMQIPTALTQCLTIALYMGFREIFLLGFDLDQVCRIQKRDSIRFYGHSPVTANDAEEKEVIRALRAGDIWFSMWLILQQLALFREHATRHGQQIINLTDGGLMESFDRKPYEDVMPSTNREVIA